MSFTLTEEQVDDLLNNIIETENPNYWKQGDKLICCPVHGESRPSMGVSIEKQVCHCFSCGFAGDFASLLMYSLPDKFGLNTSTDYDFKRTNYRAYRKAREFLADRYELEYHELGYKSKIIKRYEEVIDKVFTEDSRKTLPRFKIAPFMSGKETYGYFFLRGFTKKDMQTFMIGRDLSNKTITIPVFYEDGMLAGVIGRYIDPKRKKNERYKIYDSFQRGNLLYPLDKAEPIDGEVILVEGQFDAIRMYNFGYSNTYALMTNSISRKQAEWLCNNCHTVIWLGDNDERGLEGREKARKLFKDKLTFKTVKYPDYGKDVCDWSKEDIKDMIAGASSSRFDIIRRI